MSSQDYAAEPSLERLGVLWAGIEAQDSDICKTRIKNDIDLLDFFVAYCKTTEQANEVDKRRWLEEMESFKTDHANASRHIWNATGTFINTSLMYGLATSMGRSNYNTIAAMAARLKAAYVLWALTSAFGRGYLAVLPNRNDWYKHIYPDHVDSFVSAMMKDFKRDVEALKVVYARLDREILQKCQTGDPITASFGFERPLSLHPAMS